MSPTELRLTEVCPLQTWFSHREPFETAAPTLGLAIGQIVHFARNSISRFQFDLISNAQDSNELHNDAVVGHIRSIISEAFDRHYYLDAFGQSAVAEQDRWSRILEVLEENRAKHAVGLWSEGRRGSILAAMCCPTETEVEWYDGILDIHGFCDELWIDELLARPVELKTSPPKPGLKSANRVQVAAYAYLAKHVGGLKVRDCAVSYLGDQLTDSFQFTSAWEKSIADRVAEVRLIRLSNTPPSAKPAEETCAWCPFQHQCPESAAPSVEDSISRMRLFDDFSAR